MTPLYKTPLSLMRQIKISKSLCFVISVRGCAHRADNNGTVLYPFYLGAQSIF